MYAIKDQNRREAGHRYGDSGVCRPKICNLFCSSKEPDCLHAEQRARERILQVGVEEISIASNHADCTPRCKPSRMERRGNACFFVVFRQGSALEVCNAPTPARRNAQSFQEQQQFQWSGKLISKLRCTAWSGPHGPMEVFSATYRAYRRLYSFSVRVARDAAIYYNGGASIYG